MKKVSLGELAKTLKVSKTLISLVLNGKGDEYGISRVTQKRVLDKARELNYRPNLMARGLRTGHSNVIGLVVADISNPFYAKISRSIEDNASRHGYQLIVCSTEEDIAKEQRLVDMLVHEQHVNGVIISTTQESPEQFQQLKKDGVPLVLIDRFLPKLTADYVGVDNYRGAFEATEHLIRTGYRKIGMLTISPSFLSTITDRAKGFLDAMKKHGIKQDPRLVKEIPFQTIRESVHQEVKRMVAPPLSIEALFVVNNNLAAYALEYIHETGLRIPQDVAVLAFDDVEFFRFSNPPVTAVAQPLEEIGNEAVALLMDQIKAGEKKPKPKKIELPTKLVVRKSCGAFLKV